MIHKVLNQNATVISGDLWMKLNTENGFLSMLHYLVYTCIGRGDELKSCGDRNTLAMVFHHFNFIGQAIEQNTVLKSFDKLPVTIFAHS